MEDMNDPVVAEDKIPSYEIVEDRLRQIDSAIIITKVFYLPASRSYKFQLIKKEKICMMEIPKRLLDSLKVSPASVEELKGLLRLYIDQPEFWIDYKR